MLREKTNKCFSSGYKMKISREAVASMRIRYLAERLEEDLSHYAETGDRFSLFWAIDIFQEIAYIKKKITFVKSKKTTNGITDEMIQVARETDVRMVVDFPKGRNAYAWCHDDKSPSLFYGNRTNRAVCPVCNESFSAIDVLIKRDGMSFVDAVRSLQ